VGDDDDNADEITVDNEYDNANKSNNDADDDVVNTVMMMKPNTPETFSSILNLGNSDLFTYVVHVYLRVWYYTIWDQQSPEVKHKYLHRRGH